MKHTITVLQDDIDNGVPGKPGRCAIALAAKRELFVDYVLVNGFTLSTDTESGLLPYEAKAFIPRFDQKLPVEPFKFEIDMQPRVNPYEALVASVGYEPFKSFKPAVLSSFKVYTDEWIKSLYAQHTTPFVPKYTASATNEFVDKIPPFATGGLITGSTV